MRVLEIEIFGRGGLTHYVWNLARELGRRGVEVTIATAAEYELDDKVSSLPPSVSIERVMSRGAFRLRGRLPYRTLRMLKGVEFFTDAATILALVRRTNPDLVHVHCTNSIVVWLLLWLRLTRRPIVYTVHDVTPHERSIVDKPLYRTIYALSDHLIAHSDEDRRRLLAEFRLCPEMISVIPHGEYSFFDDASPLESTGDRGRAAARGRMGIDAGAPVALFFGFIREYKGLDILLDAWPAVLAACPEARLVVAGDPARLADAERERLEAQAKSLGAVTELGYIPFDRVPEFFVLADVLVLPYRRISQSGVLFLSFAQGVPVVATRVGAFPEVIRDGENGILVAPERPAELAEALARVLADAPLRARLAEAGARTARELFSWETIAGRTLSLFGRLVGAARGAGTRSGWVPGEEGRE